MNAGPGSKSVNLNRPETAIMHGPCMRAPLITLAALGACALSGGCVTAVAGAAAGVGLFAMQDRTIGEGIDDAMASQEVKTRLMAADEPGFREVDVEVAEGNLLLSGTAPSEQHRQAAELIARNVRSVHTVYNEIFVGQHSSLARNAQDEMITAQIRARLAASPNVRAINVNIETFHGNVYLMGVARTQAELERAAQIASITSGVRRVVSFMQVRALSPGSVAAPPAPPAPIGLADQGS
jgi:osmotically-inducible protein OsmY